MTYLNEQIKNMYQVSDRDFLKWCEQNKKAKCYKDTVAEFVYKLRTGRLVKDSNGNLQTKRIRRKK